MKNQETMEMTITNITYDGPTKSQSKALPTEMTLPSWVLEDILQCAYESEVNGLISDYISDETGWCVDGYEVTELCHFNNLEGFDDSNGFYPSHIDILGEAIRATFGIDRDGKLYIDYDERYFKYTESDNSIKVSGNF